MVSSEDLRDLVSDYLAVEHLRVFRQLLVRRCGILAAIAFVAARLIPGMSVYAKWVPAVLFLIPPLWVWAAEIRLERRLPPEKVIKSP